MLQYIQLGRLALVSMVFAATLSLPDFTQAAQVGAFRFSGLVGQVGLLGEPGETGANSVGYGLSAGYRLDERLALDIQYVMSSHSEIDHRNLSVGGDYYLGDYESAYPHISVGMSFINNRFRTADRASDAAAVFFGGGLEFELQRNLTLGPQLRYTKAFEARATIDGRDVRTIQDSYSLMLRLMYTLGSD